MAAAFLLALGLHDKGLNMGEEGQILTEARAILGGKVLYRDIDGYVAPGVWYLTAALMALGAETVNATRLLMVALFALQVGVVFALTLRAASLRAALASACVLALLKVLAFPLGNFVWYTEFSIFFGLAALWALFAYERDGGLARLAAAGAAAALAVVFKQNIGGYVWIALSAHLLLHHRTRRELLAFQLPVAGIGCATLGYFTAVGALPELVRGLLVVPFSGFYEAGRLSYLPPFTPARLTPMESYIYTPVLYWEQRFLRPEAGAAWAPVARGIAVGVYAAPVVVALAAGHRLLRRRPPERELQLLLLGAAAIFLGSFPRADFAHVTQNGVAWVPVGAWLAARSRWRRALWIGAAPLAAVGAAFCASLLLHLPYRHRFEHPRARVWVSQPVYRGVVSTLAWLDEAVPPEAPISIIPGTPMYYFLSGRPVPHRYTVMLQPNVGFDGGASAVRLLEELGVRHVVYGASELPGMPPFESFAPRLVEYLETRFSPVASRRFRSWETVRFLERNGGS
jgi:hypothetical protein